MDLTFIDAGESLMAFRGADKVYEGVIDDFNELKMFQIIVQFEDVTDVIMTDFSCLNREIICELGWDELYDHVADLDRDPVVKYPRDVALFLLGTIVDTWLRSLGIPACLRDKPFRKKS